MRKVFENLLKKRQLVVSLVFFGALCAVDAGLTFGYDGTTDGYWRPIGASVRNVVCYTLLISSVCCFLGHAARWVLVPFFAWSVVCDLACVYCERVYHVPLYTVWLQAVSDATGAEIAEFVRMVLTPTMVCVLLAAMAVVGYYGYLMFRRPHGETNDGRCWRLGIFMVAPFVLFNLLLMNSSAGCAQMYFTSCPICTYIQWRDHRGAQRAFKNANLPHRVKTVASAGELPNLLIVIGESSTRTHWHLYGYDRETTPKMDARAAAGEISVLQGVTCAMPNTGPALEHLLTDSEASHPEKGSWTLPEVLRRAGYRTALVSNQIADEHSAVYQVFNGCESRLYLERVLHEAAPYYDEVLLPYVEKAFEATNNRPAAVFVHLAGMHYPVRNCYPERAVFFTGDDRVARYDNAVRYQDEILDRLLTLAKGMKNSVFFFVSDHGETPDAEVWRDFLDPADYAIPALVAPAQEGLVPNMRQDELTAVILRLAHVELPIKGGE